MEENTYSEQFAQDYLLVAMNDHATYTRLLEKAEGRNLPELSDLLRDEWESMADKAIRYAERAISETASLFLAQTLLGIGSRPFDLIAKAVLAKKEEVNA
jgi:hypothetical protein